MHMGSMKDGDSIRRNVCATTTAVFPGSGCWLAGLDEVWCLLRETEGQETLDVILSLAHSLNPVQSRFLLLPCATFLTPPSLSQLVISEALVS